MGCKRGTRAHALTALILTALSSIALRARAEETPLAIVGAAFESPAPTLAPLIALRWPLGEARALTVSQIGWTSSVSLDVPAEPDVRYRSSLQLTPIYAGLSHDVYDESGERAQPERVYDDTSLRLTSGPEWRHGDDRGGELRVAVRAVLDREWLGDYEGRARAAFDTAFFGLEASAVLESVSWREPLGGRIDGVQLQLRGQSLLGAAQWTSAQLIATLGLRSHALFLGLRATAFTVDLDTEVTRFVIGGSWDWLGESAVVGYPLGAFRLARGGAATASFDVALIDGLELGARQSIAIGAERAQAGSAVLVQLQLSGVRAFVGAGMPDRALAAGRFEALLAFAGVRTALFFLP